MSEWSRETLKVREGYIHGRTIVDYAKVSQAEREFDGWLEGVLAEAKREAQQKAVRQIQMEAFKHPIGGEARYWASRYALTIQGGEDDE